MKGMSSRRADQGVCDAGSKLTVLLDQLLHVRASRMPRLSSLLLLLHPFLDCFLSNNLLLIRITGFLYQYPKSIFNFEMQNALFQNLYFSYRSPYTFFFKYRHIVMGSRREKLPICFRYCPLRTFHNDLITGEVKCDIYTSHSESLPEKGNLP